jgi:ferredoxin-type protein NapG
MSRRTASRRRFLGGLVAIGLTPGCGGLPGAPPSNSPRGTVLPPTAGDFDTFASKCIRCFRCGEVCTAGCIEFHPPWAGPKKAGLPYLVPREAGCNTCMRCTEVCPTGALTPTATDDDSIIDAVDMGLAYVDESLCLSHLGRICGVCHDACPFGGRAIKLASHAKPEVQDACVGCGRCEERCPQVPSAIRVFAEEPGPRWVGPEKV